MLCRIISAEVTNNKDPKKMGRIKFKSKDFLSGKEHPAWVNPAWPNMYKGSGIFIPTDIGSQIKVLIPEASDDVPLLFFPYPTRSKDIPTEARKEGYYLKRAIWKFKTIGYILFDILDKVVTILSTGKLHLVSTEETAVYAPKVYLGAYTIDDDDGKGVVRKQDLQKAIDDLRDACNAKFEVCRPGGGVGDADEVTVEASEISYTE